MNRSTQLLVGGRNRSLASHLAHHVVVPGYQLVTDLEQIPRELRGLHPDNPVNQPRGGGAQVELSPRVRGISPRSGMVGDDGLTRATSALVAGLVAAARSWTDHYPSATVVAPNNGRGTRRIAWTLNRRHRQRRGRADRRLRAVGPKQGDPVRGRHPARRSCPHPFRRPRRRDTSSASTRAFLVHNDRTYPTLCRLFPNSASPRATPTCRCRSVTTRSGSSTPGPAASAGCSRRPCNLARPRYLRMLLEVKRFHRVADPAARRRAPTTVPTSNRSGAFVERHGFSDYFVERFMTPLVAAVWSCAPGEAMRYPARYLFALPAAPRHVVGVRVADVAHRRGRVGTYVEAIATRVHEIAAGVPVRAVQRVPEGVLDHRRRRRAPSVRRGRHRHSPRSGPADDGRANRRRARRARRDSILDEPRATAHG